MKISSHRCRHQDVEISVFRVPKTVTVGFVHCLHHTPHAFLVLKQGTIRNTSRPNGFLCHISSCFLLAWLMAGKSQQQFCLIKWILWVVLHSGLKVFFRKDKLQSHCHEVIVTKCWNKQKKIIQEFIVSFYWPQTILHSLNILLCNSI